MNLVKLIVVMVLMSILLMVLYNISNREPENDVVKSIGIIRTDFDIRYIAPTKNKGEFIYPGNRVLLISASENQININDIKVNEEIFPGNIVYHIDDIRTLSDHSYYMTSNTQGYLVNSNYELIRTDEFQDIEIGRSWISPLGDYAVFSHSTVMAVTGFIVVKLPSNKIIHSHPDEFYIGMVKAQDKLYQFSMNHKKFSEMKILIRETNNWKIIKEIPLDKDVYVFQDCALFCEPIGNHQGVMVLGTTDGRLLFLDYPSFTVTTELKVSPKMITTMCKIDDRTIAIGDEACQLYLVDVKSHEIKMFPKMEYSGGVLAMAYQPSSRILAAGHGIKVRLWKLKDAAFAD